MSKRIVTALLALATVLLTGTAVSQDLTGENMQSLDGQVQEIKSDVLDISSELRNLEERLLYPSGTQLAIFVAVGEQKDFRLDAVKIEIDGQLATHHIYSFNELEALQKGGVQNAYTGNVVTGAHELRVTVIGKTDGGEDFSQSGTFTFSKDVKPKTLGITLSEPGLGGASIQVGDW
ncbi:MAG: hypothetical protein WBN09_09270 [Woeseiaceae bacterium]